MRSISAKHARETAKYNKLKSIYLRSHPVCQICRARASDDIHHVSGRVAAMLCDTRFWLAICRVDHDRIHANPQWARSNGYLVSQSLFARQDYLASLAEAAQALETERASFETDPPF